MGLRNRSGCVGRDIGDRHDHRASGNGLGHVRALAKNVQRGGFNVRHILEPKIEGLGRGGGDVVPAVGGGMTAGQVGEGQALGAAFVLVDERGEVAHRRIRSAWPVLVSLAMPGGVRASGMAVRQLATDSPDRDPVEASGARGVAQNYAVSRFADCL